MARRIHARLWGLLAFLAAGCVGTEEVFVTLDGPDAGQWILIEGEGNQARLTALGPGAGAVRAPEDRRLRALVYETPAFPGALPAVSTVGAPLPTPTSMLELVPEGDGFVWQARPFGDLELRIPNLSPCAQIETELQIALPLADPNDVHKSSLFLRDGRLLIGGVNNLYVVEGEVAERSTWSSTSSSSSGGPRALSEGPDGLWFEAAQEIYFSPLTPRAEIRPEARGLRLNGQPDHVFASPESASVWLVDLEGMIYEYTSAAGVRPIVQWESNGRVTRRPGQSELLLLREGEIEPPSLAAYARYRDDVLDLEHPFGTEATRKISYVVSEGIYFIGAEGGRVAFDRGEGWGRADVETGSLAKVRSFALTDRGFLMGTNSGELVEHIWGFGNCPPASLLGLTLETLYRLDEDRYLLVPEQLSDAIRIFRLSPPLTQ